MSYSSPDGVASDNNNWGIAVEVVKILNKSERTIIAEVRSEKSGTWTVEPTAMRIAVSFNRVVLLESSGRVSRNCGTFRCLSKYLCLFRA